MRRATILAGLLGLVVPPAADAWLTEGHRRVAADAVRALPAEVPSFFRAGALAVGHSAADPDTWKLRATPELRDGEGPEHYLDWELLEGRALPRLRSEYWALLAEIGLEPASAGYLPYSMVEGWQRLVVAFAEHRAWPDNRHVKAKTLVFAGWLAHYAADACQPLHTSIHHDGRALPDHSSPRTGIHHLVDGLFEQAPFDRAAARLGVVPTAFEDIRHAVLAGLTESHALVDRVYALEQGVRQGAEGHFPPEVVAFARERYRTTLEFLASLFLSAWRESAVLEIPDWFGREGTRSAPTAPVGSSGP